MNPSDEKQPKKPSSSAPQPRVLPGAIIFLLIFTIGAILFYFNRNPQLSQAPVPVEQTLVEETPDNRTSGGDGEQTTVVSQTTSGNIAPVEVTAAIDPEAEGADPGALQVTEENTTPEPDAMPAAVPAEEVSSCDRATAQLHGFYKHLDGQPYMADYKLTIPSRDHFTALIKKLLANPPQVAREADDLYTILKNTAHFFRVSGKDNILMMKGILDHEKGSLEQILADYHLLVTTADCHQSPFANDIDREALYEYACFFLNTMGGRLYLFRRDAQSRMVVTYYAILLVDQANSQQNNRHGIDLRPAVDMLLSEMEAGGSRLKRADFYLDTLYDLKEKYQ